MGQRRLLALLLAVLLGLSQLGTAAQHPEFIEMEGLAGNTYTNPRWGYTVSWDPGFWDPVEGLIDRVAPNWPEDRLILNAIDESSPAQLEFRGYAGYDGNAKACLDSYAEPLVSSITDFILMEDEDGTPITGETDDGAVYGVYGVFFDSDAEPDRLIYAECRTVVEGEVVLLITMQTDQTDTTHFHEVTEAARGDRYPTDPPRRGDASSVALTMGSRSSAA
jgi:hypothetical protein